MLDSVNRNILKHQINEAIRKDIIMAKKKTAKKKGKNMGCKCGSNCTCSPCKCSKKK